MKLYYSLLILIVFASCRKYVEVDQKGVKTLKTLTDYRYVMNNNSVLEYDCGLPVISGDDVDLSDVTRANQLGDYQRNAYTWAADYYNETQSDADWDRMYKIIYVCNEVLGGVLSSEEGTDAEKRQVYAEALVHRADAYLNLVNIYAKQYDAATASSDLGLPLPLTSNLFVSLDRVSVKQVYDRIEADLLASIGWLPEVADYNVRPAKVSAYALLSRTYLNKREFEKAGKYADSALLLQSGLVDLNSGTIPPRIDDPEIMLSKLVGGYYDAIALSDKVVQLLGTKDLRYTMFTRDRSSFTFYFSTSFTGRVDWHRTYNTNGLYTGPSVPEMMLIKAEVAARAGETDVAMDQLNKLRQKRFTSADYQPLTSGSAADALVKVVEERQREFFGTGRRWMDQRRLNKDAALAVTITRSFRDASYTLEPNSNRYTYPIGPKYIILNPEIQQNER